MEPLTPPLDGTKAVLFNPELKKYLVVLRDDFPHIFEPNTWGLVGGGIDAGEDPKAALLREVEEEIGLILQEVSHIKSMPVQQEQAGIMHEVTGHFYYAEITTPLEEITLTEGQRLAYMTAEEIMTLPNLSQCLPQIIKEFL